MDNDSTPDPVYFEGPEMVTQIKGLSEKGTLPVGGIQFQFTFFENGILEAPHNDPRDSGRIGIRGLNYHEDDQSLTVVFSDKVFGKTEYTIYGIEIGLFEGRRIIALLIPGYDSLYTPLLILYYKTRS